MESTELIEIREDAKAMVDQLDDGKISTMERLQNAWMKLTRGDIPNRFSKIKDTYLDVPADAKEQMFMNQKEEIKLLLRRELASKYFGMKRGIEIGLEEDPVVQSALMLLNNPNEYRNILTRSK